MIAVLKRKFHGTRGIVSQILNGMATAQNAKHEINKQVSQPIAAKAYCGSLFKKAKKRELQIRCIFIIH